MTDALRYEWVRLTTLRSTYWLIGFTLVLYAVLTFVVALNVHPSATGGSLITAKQTAAGVVTLGASTGYAPLLMAYIIGIVGVFSMGHEYRHGMIRATLTAIPDRATVLMAKTVVVVIVASVSSFLACMIGMVNAAVFSDADLPVTSTEIWKVILGVVLYTVFFSLAGFAFAGLLRNQTAAVALLLLVPTVIESIVRILLLLPRLISRSDSTGGLATLIKFLPFDAGGKMYTRAPLPDITDIVGTRPYGPVGGGIVMAVFVALLLGLMTYLFIRRDA